MKKCFGVLCFLLCILQWGCGINDGQTESVSEQSMSKQNMSGQSVSSAEDPYILMPDQFTANGFYIVSENMLNYEDAVEEMVIAQSKDRERVVVSFCNTFPEELQEAFQYEIEHYREVDVHFSEYNTGLEWHAIEEFPYEISSLNMYTEGYVIHYQELDLDGDGEVEYLFRKEPLSVYDSRVGYVYKIVDGEPVLCFLQPLEELGMESLYYEGDYYLYMGRALVRCGEGCDLLSNRYEDDSNFYTPDFNCLSNTCLEYIMGWIEKGDYTWHEGYRAEGYEGIDFKAYLPEGLENHLPALWSNNNRQWYLGGKQFFERYYFPVEAEGKEYQYVFLRQENALWGNRDVVVMVLDPVGEVKYNIACMYSLIYTDEFSLTDEREYIDEAVAVNPFAYECAGGRMQNESYDELMETYQPYHVKVEFTGCHYLEGNPLLLLYYGEKGIAIAAAYGEEFEVIYDNEDNDRAEFVQSEGILKHTLDNETGTESYLYYKIYADVYDTEIVLTDSFIRVDEDRDGLFTEPDSYYFNGYELDQDTWERWVILYAAYLVED